MRRNHGGFTYLALLFILAIMGALWAVAGVLYSSAQQRDRERELLAVGNEIRSAIGNYYERTPGSVKRYPLTLEALLLDNRFLGKVRHLRRLYPDPMTGKMDWGLIRAADGGVMGVHSISEKAPIKRSGFRQRDAGFQAATRYGEWRFVYKPNIG